MDVRILFLNQQSQGILGCHCTPHTRQFLHQIILFAIQARTILTRSWGSWSWVQRGQREQRVQRVQRGCTARSSYTVDTAVCNMHAGDDDETAFYYSLPHFNCTHSRLP